MMTAPFYKIGGVATDNLSPILQFQAQFIENAHGVSHLRLPFQTTGYQVPVGKTLYVIKMLEGGSELNAAHYKLGYCDNDVGFDQDQATSPRTNPVMSVGQDSTSNNGISMWGANASTSQSEKALEQMSSLIIMAIGGKFPFIFRKGGLAGLGATVLIWGIEL